MCFCFKCCCDLSCLEPAEDWDITASAGAGELGAGWLYKCGKGTTGTFGKRFFTVTETKLLYYADESRQVVKGEYSLVGASAKVSPTRANARNKFHFILSHPTCGVREFYAKNNVRRSQWIDMINNTATAIGPSMTGNLLKQGGLGKSTWQERFCICAGRTLDYYESPQDSQPKGSINLVGAKIREFTLKDQKWCVEIVSQGGKKGSKKYSFACPSENLRSNWMDQLKRSSKMQAPSSQDVVSPMQSQAEDGGSSGKSGFFGKKKKSPPEKRGYLMKKSPSMFTGYQKRYFVLCAPGDLRYFETEEDATAERNMKGVVQVAEIMPDAKGLEKLAPKLPNDFVIRIGKSKSYQLQCESPAEVQDWIDALNAWMMHLSSDD